MRGEDRRGQNKVTVFALKEDYQATVNAGSKLTSQPAQGKGQGRMVEYRSRIVLTED